MVLAAAHRRSRASFFRAPAAGHFSRAFGARRSRHRLSGAHYDVCVSAFFAFFLIACTWSSGSKRDKFFLLHQSIDLDELYPTVPVSQIVTRRKYFISKMRGHVHCTHRRASVGRTARETQRGVGAAL